MGARSDGGGTARRSVDLDLFKTLLVVGMIVAHAAQILEEPLGALSEAVSNVVNLVSFSGFLFAFGWGTALSSRRGEARSRWPRLRGPLQILLAFYVSGLAHLVLLEGGAPAPSAVAALLTLTRLPGNTEFLASFFVLSAGVAVLRGPLAALVARPACLTLLVAASALTGLIRLDGVEAPWVSILLGTTNTSDFPLLPYLLWFLLGLHAGGRGGEVGAFELGLASAATYLFVAVAMLAGHLPSRFPPALLWVVGPALFIHLYRALCLRVVARVDLPRPVTAPGRHALVFLVVSNVVLFALRAACGPCVHGLGQALGVAAVAVGLAAAAVAGIEAARRGLRSRRGSGRLDPVPQP